MSLKHHPDKVRHTLHVPGKSATRLNVIYYSWKGGVEEKFKQIANAYQILSDPELKRAYDATLHTNLPASSGRSRYYGSEYDWA